MRTSCASRAAEYIGNDPADADFRAWFEKVDAAVERRLGLSVMDLPDKCWRDIFDSGTDPEDAAKEALAEEDMDLEDEEFDDE